jgi:SAM-dependent methyltransferase
METKMSQPLKTWATNHNEEDAMNDDHRDLWLRMIRMTPETELQNKTILDFGCNQGGFLKTLHRLRPFKSAIGVDIAQESLEQATLNLAGEPIDYMNTGFLNRYTDHFDVAYSHEVLYLLSDLREHARLIKTCLKEDGVYYAAIGCHTDNPLWPEWRKLISSYSNVKVQDYSLDDYADAFFREGFSVSALPFAMDDFIALKPRNEYFPKVRDSLEYYTRNKIFFRFKKN